MSNRKWTLLVLVVGAFGLGGLALAGWPLTRSMEGIPGRAQQIEKPKPGLRLSSEAVREEEKAIREAAAGFSAAYNKADLDALLAFWSSEGEYVSESGKTYQGKAQLRAILQKALTVNKGQKHTVTIQKIRFLKPDVAQEEGTVILTSAHGEQERNNYVALWLKMDGKWLLGSVRDLPETPDEQKARAHAYLKPLSWLVGDWKEKDGDATLSVRWSAGHAFLLMDWQLKRGEEQLQVHQRLGWDPVAQQLHSWVYDSTGGFGEGIWDRNGNSWTVGNEGTYPDGRLARSINVWKYLDDNSFRWEARDREVDEMPLPDHEATYIRVTSDKGR